MPEPQPNSVTIENVSGATIFNPKTKTININDSVFWVNKTSEPHQPAPDGGADNQWLTEAVQPNDPSPQVVFDTVPSGKTTSFPYHCAKHPTRANEKGVITVTVSS